MDGTNRGGKNIQSVQRAIDILNCFSAAEPALSLGEISARLQLNKATVHGLLNTLHNNAYVAQNSKGQYLLGRAFFAKATLGSSSVANRLLDIAAGPLQELCNAFHASGILSAVANHDLRRLHMATPINSAFILQPSAQSGPLYAMASGKLILAYSEPDFLSDFLKRTEFRAFAKKTLRTAAALQRELTKIRHDGVSYERDELAEGVASVAVPIFDSIGKLYGTISLTGMSAPIFAAKEAIARQLLKLQNLIESQNFIF